MGIVFADASDNEIEVEARSIAQRKHPKDSSAQEAAYWAEFRRLQRLRDSRASELNLINPDAGKVAIDGNG